MLKVLRLKITVSRANYKPQEIRRKLEAFLSLKLKESLWLHRLQMVASEMIANSCEHRFDDDQVELEVSMTCYHHQVRVQMILEDFSNLLIMQRYNNLAQAVGRHKNGKKTAYSVNGRGLHIILNWTDAVYFSKKRAGGLKVKALKTVSL